MSEKLLLQILEELKSIKEAQQSMEDMQQSMLETQQLMQAQLKETNQIVSAIRDRQEETDAKLDNMDIHTLHGAVAEIKDNQLKIKGEIVDMKSELSFTTLKTQRNEMEIFKLRGATEI